MTRPTRDQLEAARDRAIPEVIAPGLDVVFCGINPSLYSGATGHHFARPGNRFWPTLHRSGFTPRLLRPEEQHLLLDCGLGITNMVNRATARADELSDDELRAGAVRLAELARQYRPKIVAMVGITAYRTAFGNRRARTGPQPEHLADAGVWVLPNPSGLNANYQLDDLAAEFRALRESLGR
ncbi:G/U mismatch-specific DNA glycosylase [Streptoalloteichus hindustanus]|uniref:G/U mismatch-specific uracil-DNA glycosylase n=1 Tax=Streptoalloteichus hindustanus TaxID=2017 RepID=A0A1M4YEE6_STRHI|nr:G/U mismatch-specific DNA glycosylase [Streptoalloteichus hindustanus]SHF03973.1 G/U mismatch-specific uracil-DNA glycosylase [Streptoalloteichus hindustanus]